MVNNLSWLKNHEEQQRPSSLAQQAEQAAEVSQAKGY